MPLFAAAVTLRGGSPDCHGGAIFASFAAGLPFYAGRTAECWSSDGYELHWILEEDDGIERGATAFFGRPITWSDEHRADGCAPLDPAFYDRPGWAETLDGRCCVLRHADGALELYTDPMGAYPVYRAEGNGALWIANSPVLAARLAGLSEAPVDRAALAGIIGGGWSLSGAPPQAGVERIDPGWLWRFGADGEQRVQALGVIEGGEAAAALRAAIAAQADWPGRPNIVPLTGGRDSRAVLAAALAAGLDFTSTTGGGEADPDVVIARQLAERAGVAHSLMGALPGGDRLSDPRRAKGILWALTGGTATLANGAGFPLAPWTLPRPLWHSGQGGETARRVYGDATDADALLRTFLARRPGRSTLLTTDATALVRDELAAFVAEADCAPADLPDVFYLRRRMGTWAGPTHAAVEPIRDVTSILWSRRVAPHLLAGSPTHRLGERFHREVVTALAPELADLPFQDGTSWSDRTPPSVARAWKLAGKVRREAARRVTARRAPAPEHWQKREGPFSAMADPRQALLAMTRDAALEHPVMELLVRSDVEGLFSLPPDGLDEWRWHQVWRLATLTL